MKELWVSLQCVRGMQIVAILYLQSWNVTENPHHTSSSSSCNCGPGTMPESACRTRRKVVCCSFQELLTMDQKWGEEEVFYNAVMMMRMISLFVVLLHIIFAHYFVCKHVHVPPPTPQLSFSASTKSSYCCRLLFIIFGILACQFGYYCVHTC